MKPNLGKPNINGGLGPVVPVKGKDVLHDRALKNV